MRHVKYLFSTLILLLCSVTASAYNFVVDGIYYNITSEEDLTVEVTCHNIGIASYSGEVVIPSNVTYDMVEYSVTSIGWYAFDDCRSLTSITIPESVTSIGERAFNWCSGLTSITIPENVTSIGTYAFLGCSSLTTINIPESVTYIGHGAFSDCSGLTSITIGEGVKSIGERAFSNCSGLTSITIPESVTSIGRYAFYDCTGELTVNCNIPESDKDYGAFKESKFTKVTIGEGVTSIGKNAFYECSIPSITIPESVTSIGYRAFYGCTGELTVNCNIPSSAFSGSNFTKVTIGDNVTTIGYEAFRGCSSLTSITIPESVTSIGNYAFENCGSLTSITIPESVTSIGGNAFSGCTGELIVNCNIPSAISSWSGAFCDGKFTKVTIGENVTSIGDYAFSGCTGELIVNCNIPSGAFESSKFTKVTIGDSVIFIGDNAFYNCSSLTSITVGESVTSIGQNVFAGTGWYNNQADGVLYVGKVLYQYKGMMLKNASIEVKEGTKGIAGGAFGGCDRLASIALPESVTSIGASAFTYCISLTSVNIPEGVTSIENQAFAYCSGLTSITLPESVTSIGERAFEGCISLTSITLPESVTSIGASAFSGCSGLTSVNIPESVISIGDNAFRDCGLTSVILPEGVTSVGGCAFWGCGKLTSIVLPKSLESVGSSAFFACSKLFNVYCYAESVPSINIDAFYGSNFGNAILRVPESALDSYKSTGPWNGFGSILPFGVFITDIGLSQSSATLIEGETLSLGITLTPEDSDKNLITWSSSNPNIATVDNQGKVKAVAPGTTTITATAIDGGEASDTCEVTVDYADYVITYLVDGEVYATDTIGRTSAVTPLAEPVKEGYTFSGWSEIPETMPGHDVTVSGTFTINKYLVNFALDGVVISSSSLEYGTAIVPPEVAEREGYTFSGWQNLLETVPANDTTIIGNFLINSYTVTYIVEEEVYHTDTLAFGSQITAIKYPVKEGYTFDGWSETPEFMPAKDLTITGTFSINSYRITYTVDGVVHRTDSIEYGDTIAVIAEPTREGYTFSGWSEIPETMPAKDVAVSGKFTINKYQITYIVGEDVYHTDSIAYGTYITSIRNPVKEGYTFIEWVDIPEKMPASDVTTIGSFSINKYKVTYTADDVTIYTDSIVYGGQIKDIASPTKEGYSFDGWEKVYQTMPARDIVINGTFTINKYQISYVVGGETIHTDSITYNERITPIDSPKQEGFNFSGWIGVPGIMPAYDVTVGGEFFIKNMQTDSQGLMYVLNEETETFELSNYEGNLTGTIVIPTDLYGYPVKGIKDRALMGAENLIHVVIPENISSVGYRVFYGCNNISYIEWETTAPVDAKCFDEPARHGNLLVYVKDTVTQVTYQGNVIVDGVAEKIVISNAQPLRNIRDFKARNISFTREFAKRTKIGTSGGWEAMMLPFDVQRVVSETRGELKPFGEADFDTSLPYWLGELQADGTFAATQRIVANKPFIMQLPNSDEYEDRYNVEGKVTFSAEEVTVHATTDVEQEKGEGYVLLGSYEGIESDNYIYALNDEEYTVGGDTYMPGGVFVAGSRAIRPFEAYIYSASANRAPYLRIGGCDTGMEDLVADKEDVWHTLQGIRLSGRPTERGVYIRNGKKVMVK